MTGPEMASAMVPGKHIRRSDKWNNSLPLLINNTEEKSNEGLPRGLLGPLGQRGSHGERISWGAFIEGCILAPFRFHEILRDKYCYYSGGQCLRDGLTL